MTARFWLSWLILATAVLGLGLRSSVEPSPWPRAYYVAADTDTTAPQMAVVKGDSLSQQEENGALVQFYIGNVVGLQDSTILHADWAKRLFARPSYESPFAY